MNTKIKYRVNDGWFDFSFFWKQGIISFSDTCIIIDGSDNYKIPFSKITRLSRFLPRIGAGLYIILKCENKNFYIRIPNTTFLSSTTNSDTEELYQHINSEMKTYSNRSQIHKQKTDPPDSIKKFLSEL
jgi:hypothetical protein